MATISIADNDARVQYTQAVTANTTQLTIDFPFFDNDDINVIVTSAAGVDTTLTRGTGTGTFAVVGTSVDDGFSGGYVTLGDTYSDVATKYTIFRDIDVERTTDFPTSGPFNISSLNTELDKIFAIEQELETKIGRTMKLADSDTAATLSLPNLDTRKGTVLAFNTTTGLPEAGPEIGDVSTIAAITTDIGTLADIEDGTDATDAIQTVAGISSDVTTVSGISANVTTVAGISANVTTVAGNNSNVTTVAGIDSDITTVAGISANVTTVANDGTDIGTVAGISSNVSTVAGISANVTTVAGISSDVTTVAGDAADIATVAGDSSDIQALAAVTTEIGRLGTADAVADLNTLATSAIVTDMDALADLATELDALGDITANITTVAGISANVTTVAGISANTTTVAGISANVTTVAGVSANVTTVAGISSDVSTVAARDTDIGTVAAADTNIGTVATNIANVNSVGGSIANVNTVATNLSSVNNFAEQYRVSATAPTNSLDIGDLWFDTTNNIMKVYGSGGFVNAGSGVNGTAERADYVVGTVKGTYDGSTTVFPVTYDVGFVDVYLNGIKLQPADFTATNGTSVTLGSAAQTSDTVSLVAYGTFELSNFSIGDANNVDLSGLADNQFLQYNSTTTNFEPATVTQATGNELENLSEDTTPQLGGNLSTNGNNIAFGDSDEAQFGDSADGEIFHNGTHFIIRETNTGGNMLLRGNSIFLESSDGTEQYATFSENGAVDLKHDNSTRLSTTSTGIDIEGDTGGVAVLRFKAEETHGTVEGINIGSNFGGLAFKTNSNGTTAERVRIDSAGTVAVGTTDTHSWSSFDGRLHLGARGILATTSGSSQVGYNWYFDGAYKYIAADVAQRYYQSAGNHIWETASSGSADGTITFSEKMRIDSSGNVGIGTDSMTVFNAEAATSRLVVAASDTSTTRTGNSDACITIANTDGTAGNTAGLHFAREDTDGTPNYSGASIVAQFPDAQVTGQYPKGRLAFLTSTSANTAPVEKMRIMESGRMEFQTPTAETGVLQGQRIDWRNENNAGIMAGIGVVRTAGYQAPGAFVIRTSTNVDSASNNSDGEISEKFRVAPNGDLTATDTSISSNSDQRLKENIADFEYDLTKFKQFQTRTFDWKQPHLHGDKSDVRGFIAQELEAVDSYWVQEIEVQSDSDDYQYLPDTDLQYGPNNNYKPDDAAETDTERTARFAKTSRLGQKDAMYVSVIQQLISKIETLETKVAALEAAE